jgi:hypothetical protein
MMELLNVAHTKTSPAHTQCNSQVDVFNKTVKKYLASFMDDTALKWETFLPALLLSYNMSYHSMIGTTPFKLLFREKARLPSFPYEDIQKFIGVKHLLQNDSICCKNYKKSPMKMQQKMDKKQ